MAEQLNKIVYKTNRTFKYIHYFQPFMCIQY